MEASSLTTDTTFTFSVLKMRMTVPIKFPTFYKAASIRMTRTVIPWSCSIFGSRFPSSIILFPVADTTISTALILATT